MRETYFILGFHCHQPTGNFGWVIKGAFDRAYKPLIDIIKRHPSVKVVLHYSGCLLDWMEENEPDFLKDIGLLVDAKQIELMGGGYYEPILPIIPEKDRLGQIRMMDKWIKARFNVAPKGFWLAERVWEPHLTNTLHNAGIGYTVVDDSHLKIVGIDPEKKPGYYITEDEGKIISVFPDSEKLRYLIPFHPVEEAIEYIRESSKYGNLVVIMDDGEKFGVWPGTHQWVHQNGWLEKFFNAIEKENSWLKPATFSEYLEEFPPQGRVYIPCATYNEMLKWSGGFFRNYLVKYEESNRMHKRMLYISEKAGSKGEAIKSLYKAQCNCAYWHGIFGGLYLSHLRHGIYEQLIKAQCEIDAEEHKSQDWIEGFKCDIDKDTNDEVILNSKSIWLLIKPSYGGSIIELDNKDKCFNIANTLARYKEDYHSKIQALKQDTIGKEDKISSIHESVQVKEQGLENYLVYDNYQRGIFQDHFFYNTAKAEDFSGAKYKEVGDFLKNPYRVQSINKMKKSVTVSLTRDGLLNLDTSKDPSAFGVKDLAYILGREISPLRGGPLGKSGTPPLGEQVIGVSIDKSITLFPHTKEIRARYLITNKETARGLCFGTSLNLLLKDPALNDMGQMLSIDSIDIKDVWYNQQINISVHRRCSLWYYSIQTVSGSEAGFEKTYQGICMMFYWDFEVEKNSRSLFEIKVKIL
ncbi:hypothetical protein B9J78_05375 [bacterium Unc6]|nr:hypothetical protein [bacterium Unc6]